MTELKLCPFCGARNNDEEIPLAVGWCIETDTCAVFCDRCGASGAERDSWEEAIEAWNRRAQECPRPLEEWHEDYGDVLWWKFPIEEPPYVGSPLCDDWPAYHTHWTPIVCPEPPEGD